MNGKMVATRLCATIALGLTGYGCSSQNASLTPLAVDSGAGGSADSGGDGSMGAGRDGSSDTGQVGTTDSRVADSAEAGLPMCNPAPADMSSCSGNPACTETCGVDISALTSSHPQRTCTCTGSRWSCPSAAGACVYPTDVDLTCLQLPTPVPGCGDLGDGGSPEGGSQEGGAHDGGKDAGFRDGGSGDGGTADGGSTLIQPTTPCKLPSSEVCGGVCGSATAPVFMDSTGTAKVGYCACISGAWQCAIASDWPL